ncbi:hypothetical protein B566_EDAN015812 [Ephemera danica]|nr:hypothetical protein B566_EDAN015812 [Ephemera danica]
MKGRDLEEATKEAAREEEERRKRIAQRQILYNQMVEEQHTVGESTVKELLLDFDEKTKKPILQVHEKLVAKLKPHQAQGVKFMWDALFESVERAQKNRGSGCILAHCMGLGKTMQVVTLVHTLLTHPELDLKIRTVLIVTPLSTVNNWCQEFRMWLEGIDEDDDVQCFNFTHAKPRERAIFLKNWQKHGGVAVMGYDMFRNLSNYANSKTNKSTKEIYQRCLIDPGPDLVVCDEGHMLKNENSKLSQCMSQLNTSRRVALTGTPLQNNLIEYHCMIQFVKPNLLGKRKEFTNRFVNPIKNGQCADSTPRDVFIMKKRAHVLHKMLEGCVQRFDYSVLTPLLKPKQEYVIKIRLTEIQVKMYQHFLTNFARQALVNKGASLFSDYQNLQRLWTHPLVLKFRADRDEEKNGLLDDEEEDSEGSLKDFIDDDEDTAKSTASSSAGAGSGSDSDVICEEGNGKGTKRKKKNKEDAKRYRTRGAVANGEVEEENEKENQMRGRFQWWHEFVKEEDFDILVHSNKMVMLFSVLRECEAIGDKVLVFSQSLLSLDLIEAFLRKVDDATHGDGDTTQFCGLKGSWNLGSDYFRLDGSCSTDNRSMWCKIFNNPKNLRARLFLISTRAGGLGINMVGANRVVLFDASWNPSNDVQSIFRVYRFGQTKPCYIYRFLAAGTMEEKIYDRQVTKLALSGRVVDEHQIDRHFNAADLEELYSFTPPSPDSDRPTMLVPKDRLFAELLKDHPDLVEGYLEHDSLLENKPEENLTEEERQAAWEDYEREKNMDAHRLQTQQQEMMERARQFQLGLANTTDIQMKEALETLTHLVSQHTAAAQTPKSVNDYNNIMAVGRELAKGNPAAVAYLVQERQRIQQQQAQQTYQRQLLYQQSLLQQQQQQQQQRNQASTSAATSASGSKIVELDNDASTDPKPKLKLREDLF